MDTIKGCGISEIEDTDSCHHIRVDKKMGEILNKHMEQWKREIDYE